MELFQKKKSLSSFQIIIFGFLAVILVGTLLLMLPFASREPGSAPFLDALFTATSATCVTGLIVHDTATYWSCFGQVVILLLIQIGGMGVVTITIAVAMVSGKKIGLMQRSLMQESISAPQVGGIVRFTGFFLKGIALIELLGAILLAPVFIKDFGVGKGIWYGVFHSISAFCNAGFDLMGVRQQYSSLTYYAGNGLVNAVIVLLILIGGLGFLTWEDIKTNKLQFKKYRMQSKVILVTDLILVIVPTVIFYFGEFHGSQWGNGLERFWLSLFQAVTPRTAGFNTADFGQMSEGGLFLMVMLMLIGGAPGSTAGGMKTTTVAVLFATALSTFRRKEDTHFFGRRIEDGVVKNAATIGFLYVALFLFGGLAISMAEGLPMLTCLFETASAVGTVGLSLGITPGLGILSRVILILLMFFGRVGGLTLIFAALSGTQKQVAKLPLEKITVG